MAVKISGLIEVLREILAEDGDLDVWMSKDAEGNAFKPMDEVSLEDSENIEMHFEGKVAVLWPKH
jgi:hypothetical protein